MASSVLKKVVTAIAGAETVLLRSEMPETPSMNLPQGKISTATRKRLVANRAGAGERAAGGT
jgi:hypothetical protein